MTMLSGNTLAEVGALIGDPARANMISALMDGRALTAGELAWHAGVSASTASEHLGKLAAAGLVAVERQGRHRYHRLAGPAVAEAMEGLMALAAATPVRHRPKSPGDEALRRARTCYDHLAGRLGTALAESLQHKGYVIVAPEGDGAAEVTGSGRRFFAEALGLELGHPATRPLCRTCLDWSERRPHLAGRLGAGLYARAVELGWVERIRDSRALTITAKGRQAFTVEFGLPTI